SKAHCEPPLVVFQITPCAIFIHRYRRRDIGPRSNSKNLRDGLKAKDKRNPLSRLYCTHLARDGVTLRAFCYAGEMTSSLDENLVLVSARKSRGADFWNKDDYDVRLGDASGTSSRSHYAPPASTRGTAVVLDDNGARAT